MPYTETDLIREVLRDLSALDATATVSTEDSAAVQVQIAPVVAELARERVVTVTDTMAIAAEVFSDLVTILAERCALRFGRPPDEERVKAAKARLAAVVRLDRTASTVFARAVLERFDALGAGTFTIDAAAVTGATQSVLDDLAAHRIATIANEAAITSAQFPHLITLVAARVKPDAIDIKLIAAAQDALRSADRFNRTAATPLVRSILDQLEIWGVGQRSIDATTVADRIGPALATLAARNVIYIPDEDGLTDAQTPAVIRYVAAFLAPKPMGDVIAQAEAELRTINRIGKGTGRRLRVDPALLGRRRIC